MASSGGGNRPGSGNRSGPAKRPGSGNRRPQQAAQAAPSAADRARDRLAQQQARGARPARPQGGRRPPQRRGRSTAATAGIFGGGLVVLVAVVIVLISVLSGSGGGKGTDPYIPPRPISAGVARAVAHVPDSELAAAGNGPPSLVSGVGKKGSGAGIVTLTGAPLMKGGKPEVLFLGSEYCPYCAATRWPLVIALSKFGTFHGLQETASSPLDYAGNTHTLDFANATYTSKYLVFDPTEEYSNHCFSNAVEKDPNGDNPPTYPAYVCANDDYHIVKVPSKAIVAVVGKYDTKAYFGQAGANGIPFIDFGGKYVESGSLFLPTVLSGADWSQIVRSFAVPTSGIGQSVLATANRYIAMLCEMTHNKPASACSAGFVKSAEKALKAS